MGLRLQLRKQQAEAGDIVLYGDESEALTHPYLARAWAKSGADLRVPAPGQAKEVCDAGVARSRHAPTHRPYQPDHSDKRAGSICQTLKSHSQGCIVLHP